uniref:Bet v I/Major latex protein domain-containing protein n=1 Tax=Opuntia streptacantha TaxID=393608 RepID=A0A7C8ZUI0_OPUST
MEGLKRRFEGEIEIRVAGGDAFHEIFLSRPHHVSKVNPEFVQGCDLHEGAFGKQGSKICWRYTLDGKALTAKQILELIDEENKIIRFNVIEGDLLKEYKYFVVTYQVIPKGEEKSLVKWIFEYQKLHPGVPEPTTLMDSLVRLAKEIDDHHHSQAK